MYKSHYIKGDEAIKLEYKKFANNLTKMKTLAKQQYYANELENSRGNLRKMWELLRTLLPGKLHGSTILISNINLNGCSISNKQQIVNEFNVFFSKVGENLSNNFNDNAPYNFKQFLTNNVDSSIFIELPRFNEVFNLINSLSLQKSVGHDNIPPYFLKAVSSIIAPALCYFFDNAFLFGIFPQSCRIAKVVPLFKSGSSENLSNYRPISILTCFSKILQKLIYTRLSRFFQKHSVFSKTQYGFQTDKFTTHAVLDVITTVYDQINDDEYTSLTLLDF